MATRVKSSALRRSRLFRKGYDAITPPRTQEVEVLATGGTRAYDRLKVLKVGTLKPAKYFPALVDVDDLKEEEYVVGNNDPAAADAAAADLAGEPQDIIDQAFPNVNEQEI